jgi:hypothetical protein
VSLKRYFKISRQRFSSTAAKPRRLLVCIMLQTTAVSSKVKQPAMSRPQKQFIRAALDEPESIRYETFPTKEDRTNKTNGRLYLSVWDLMRGYFDDGVIDAAAAQRWTAYRALVAALQ